MCVRNNVFMKEVGNKDLEEEKFLFGLLFLDRLL